MKSAAFFAYADNYLIDVEAGIIVASRAIRQAEVGAARTMIERTEQRFGLRPKLLAAEPDEDEDVYICGQAAPSSTMSNGSTEAQRPIAGTAC